MDGRRLMALAFGALAVALTATGCATSSSSTTTSRTAAAAVTTTSPSAPVRHLRIVSPRTGTRTGDTLTVRVVVTGPAVGRSSRFRYVLDGGRPSRGSGRFTFRGLTPGRHHLAVALANDVSVQSHAAFVVRTPPPAPSPATASPTQTQAPPTSSPAPTTTPQPTSPPATTTAPAPAPSPPSAGGIPQGPTAGDRDSDNNGGPSDGDGNL